MENMDQGLEQLKSDYLKGDVSNQEALTVLTGMVPDALDTLTHWEGVKMGAPDYD